MFSDPLSLYVHIPFCRTLCTYCAFNTYAGMHSRIEPYVQALTREMALVGQATEGAVSHTLYFGGGTPSLLAPAQVEAIIEASRDHLGLLPGAEITLEANPGSVTLESLSTYRALGVSRLSLGVQSAHAEELRLFGRRHTFEEAADAFRLARQAGFESLSVDLIYGAPLQTRQHWRETLNATLAWEPDHVSLYALTLEPGTSIHKRVERGKLPPLDSDLAADMYEDACEMLPRAGLAAYEISNWACPGHESIHNCQYWRNLPFLGFGAGAHGGAAGRRYWNADPVEEYISRVIKGEPAEFPLSPAVDDFEVIDDSLAMSETVILGLRLVREGVSRAAFARRFGRDLDGIFGPVIQEMVGLGLVHDDGETLRLTKRAYLISNQVFYRLLPTDARSEPGL